MAVHEAAGGASRKQRKSAPRCLRCEQPMTLKQLSPVLGTTGVDEVVYGCERCATEIKRTEQRA